MDYNLHIPPGIQVPRASFDLSFTHSTTGDVDNLYPVLCKEVYPNDTFSLNTYAAGRIPTLLYPLMDTVYLDIHYFFVPQRIIWTNSRKFWGEQDDPGDSIAYTIPTLNATATTGYSELSIFDYFGLPTKIPDYTHNVLPLRAYNKIYNRWYRDQNLINSETVTMADSGDATSDFSLQKRRKRHDYFTSGLVELQEGGTAQSLPLGTSAPVAYDGADNGYIGIYSTVTSSNERMDSLGGAGDHIQLDTSSSATDALYADLSNATSATIAQLRQAVAIQKVLELDSRSGTRYAEQIYATYGVIFDDVAIEPEFLGMATSDFDIQQIAQTSNDGTNGDVGDLAGAGNITITGGGFTKSFTEPGYVLGIASMRADISYTQGLERMWSRSTRYDFLHPLLQGIGDQSVLTKEIYCQDPATDTGATGTADNERVFCYQERNAELKFSNNMKTGLFRPNATSSLEAWHLSEEFSSLPTFNQTFIESNTPMDRAIAVTSEPHFKLDILFEIKAARPMYMYSVPGIGQSL
jgi:hypothetical protein